MTTARSEAKASWRDHVKVHPAADAWPMMDEHDIGELADDIKRNGLRVQPVFWTDPETGIEWLVDGRNRMAALELNGHDMTTCGTKAGKVGSPAVSARSGTDTPVERLGGFASMEPEKLDPRRQVIALNGVRRHMTKAQVAKACIATAEAEVATSATSAKRTKSGQLNGSTKGLRGKAVALAAKQDVSPRTVDAELAKQKQAKAAANGGPKKPAAKKAAPKKPALTAAPSGNMARSKRCQTLLRDVKLLRKAATLLLPADMKYLDQLVEVVADINDARSVTS